jgi:short-subunit dehydrogenase
MKSMEDKVIVIAGAAGGIGSATARHLARQGANVVLAARTNQTSARLLTEVKALNPGCEAYQGDLCRKQSWGGLVEFVQEKFHHLDGLINCQGILTPKDLLDLTSDEIDLEIKTNVESVVFGIQAVLPLMRSQGSGIVITVGSLGGVVPMPYSPLYCATKHAIRGFSLSMREEYRGSGIFFCLLSLGPVRTRMLDREAQGGQSHITFISSPLYPNRVARAVLSLLHRPRPELILPPATGALCLLSNLCPGLFALCYRTFRGIGRARLQAFQRQMQSALMRSAGEQS